MLSERFNWDRLRVFRLVADARSMTKAARALGESTPTVSRRINDLERELGTKLFLRSKRGVELTAAGKRLMDLVQQMQGLVDIVSDQVAFDDKTVEGAIKLKASDGIGPFWIAKHLPKLHHQLPNIQIDLEIGLAELEVVDREADFAIVYEQPNHPEIISQPLGTLHYICYASEVDQLPPGFPEEAPSIPVSDPMARIDPPVDSFFVPTPFRPRKQRDVWKSLIDFVDLVGSRSNAVLDWILYRS